MGECRVSESSQGTLGQRGAVSRVISGRMERPEAMLAGQRGEVVRLPGRLGEAGRWLRRMLG